MLSHNSTQTGSMFKFLTFTLIIVAAVLYFGSPSEHEENIKHALILSHEKTQGNSFLLHLIDPVKHSSCTAFVVDDTYALTAAHCLNSDGVLPAYKLRVFLSGNIKEYKTVDAVAYDDSTDIGVIQGDFKELSKAKLNLTDELDLRSVHVVCGYPHRNASYVCNFFRPSGRYYDSVVGEGQIFHGMSGGPVLNQTGDVVGVITAMDGNGNSYVYPLQGFIGIFPKLGEE